MTTIGNDFLQITIKPAGAELTSIVNKQTGLEYLWGGDPAFWGKHSPVLFPIVGTLKENTYYYKDQPYQLSRHGFARDQTFEIKEQERGRVSFVIRSTEQTQKVYPFDFEFLLHYTVRENSLVVTYEVRNKGAEPMYFSVGGHPAFKIPLTPDTAYTDYRLVFDEVENSGRWPISPEGLIETTSQPLLTDTHTLPLNKELFSKDALVFRDLRSTAVSLLCDKHEHGLRMDFAGFPYLGIWAAPGADFVCIEPWCGMADLTDTNSQLTEKEGIEMLAAGETWQRYWTVTLF